MTVGAGLPLNSVSATAHGRHSMRWVLRYAFYCGVQVFDSNPLNSDQAIKKMFTPAAWRLLCRSSRDDFNPILRHRGLKFDALVLYAERLIEHGWQEAPPGHLLAYLIDQSYLFFDQPARVPRHHSDFMLMRIACREAKVTRHDYAMVTDWQDQSASPVTIRMRWTNLVRRAQLWRQQTEITLRQLPVINWHFYCKATAWRGYVIEPLQTPLALWHEGNAMGSCLFKLRRECGRSGRSRFFAVRHDGCQFATLELALSAVNEDSQGHDRLYGRWLLKDCRLAYNKLPPLTLINSMSIFAWQYTLWSRRPGRAALVDDKNISNAAVFRSPSILR